nr:MAG TPA: hypothetical protein [Bacteriophage sp.]
MELNFSYLFLPPNKKAPPFDTLLWHLSIYSEELFQNFLIIR